MTVRCRLWVTAVVVAGFFVVFGHFAGVPRAQTVATIVVILLSAVPTLWIDRNYFVCSCFRHFCFHGCSRVRCSGWGVVSCEVCAWPSRLAFVQFWRRIGWRG